MDTNQFANSGGGQSQGQNQSQGPMTTPLNGVAAMVKAIMDGNDSFKQQQANQPALAPGSAVPGAHGATAVGGPMGPTPLSGTSPAAMTGGLAGAPQGAGGPLTSPFTQGGQPISIDPVTQALMSPIPGM